MLIDGIILLIIHILFYSSLGILFYKFRNSFSILPFYFYLGALEFLVSLLNSVYIIDIGMGIHAGGGNIVYCAIIWSIMLFYVMERDLESVRYIIYCLAGFQVFYLLIYSFLTIMMSNNLVLNPLNVPVQLFQTSWWIFIIGNFLQLIEAFGMVFLIEKTKLVFTRIPWWIKSIIIFNLILIFDSIIFPILLIPITPTLELSFGIDSILLKLILGMFYSIAFIIAIMIVNPSFQERSSSDTSLLKLISFSKANLIINYRESEKNQEMIRLLMDLIGHDLKNYIFNTQSRVDLILMKTTSLPADVKRDLEKIKEIQHDATSLVMNVLKLNTIQTKILTPSEIYLSKCFQEALNGVKTNYSSISITVVNQEVLNDVKVVIHPLLSDILYNILANSIKHRKIDQKEVQIDLAIKNTDDYIILDIGDKGKGIPDSQKKVIFESKDESGYKKGLGLYIAAEFLKVFKCKIEALNRPDFQADYTQGCVIRLYLKK